MVTIGADLHKRSHTVVAVDELGRSIAERTVPATPAGHLTLLRWARGLGERRWALEDCRHLSRRLERDLLTAGESVVRVPPKLMAGSRRSTREPGKSDPIDAEATARAALREPDLPTARLDGIDATSGSSSTIERTSSSSARPIRVACAGTSTSSCPARSRRPGPSRASMSSTGSRSAWRTIPAPWRASPVTSSPASAS